MWEEPDVLRQFQEHVLESTKNAYSLEDTKKHVTNNSKYTSFMRKGRLSQEQADNTRNELDDKVNMGLHPYRCGFTPSCRQHVAILDRCLCESIYEEPLVCHATCMPCGWLPLRLACCLGPYAVPAQAHSLMGNCQAIPLPPIFSARPVSCVSQ